MTPSKFTERLRTESEKTTTLFSGLAPDQWQLSVYSGTTTWTPHEVLAHIVSAEVEFLRLFKDIQAGGQGVSEDFSIDEFNLKEVARLYDRSSDDLLTDYTHARQAMVAWVEQLDPADLQKIGRHPFLGVITLEEMIKMLTLHEHLHLRDIRRLIGAT